ELLAVPKYKYEPLVAPSEIRIHVLQSGTFGSQVRCELKRISLNDKISYHALSYVWGDPNQKRPSRCGVGILQITFNLFAALQHLRQDSGTVVIWVDAVCNLDIRKLKAEFQLMGHTYYFAQETIVWLGEKTHETVESLHKVKVL
ncbi:hypothetical protein K432DRAFT_253409, partial [Lepidopterella palustris CBS 459.81]